MSEDIKNNILYKPILDYDKQYDSKGRNDYYNKNNENNIDTDDTEDNENAPSIIDKIKEIKSIIPLVPNDLKELITTPLDIIEIVIGELPEDIPDPDDGEDKIIIEPVKPDPTPDDDDKITPTIDIDNPTNLYPSIPFDDDLPLITVIVEDNDVIKKIQEEYLYDLSSIIAEYIDKLRESTVRYLENVLTSFGSNNPKMFEKALYVYSKNTKDISDNNKHLSDSIIRSQLSRAMKQKLYLKLYDIDETILHLRKCKAGVEQKIRYYQTEYSKADTFNNVVSNKILGQNRVIIDRKYRENFINLYKYLNSSVIILNECINIVISEMQAKIILLEKEGEDLW